MLQTWGAIKACLAYLHKILQSRSCGEVGLNVVRWGRMRLDGVGWGWTGLDGVGCGWIGWDGVG